MDELDELFRDDSAESGDTRADDDLDALFDEEPKKKKRTVVDRGIEIADEIFEGRFQTRSGQTSRPTLEQEKQERFGEGPSWERLKYNLARPEDEAASLRRPSPNRIAVDRFINQNVNLGDIEKEFGVGAAGPDFRRAVQQRLLERTQEQERRRVAGSSEPIGERIVKAMPVAGSMMSIAGDVEYRQSKARVDAGDATDADLRLVSEYERTQQARQARGETLPGALVDAAMTVPKLLVGGPLVAAAGLTAEGASQRAVERGGEIYSPSNVLPSAVQNVANVMLLGKASQIAQGFQSLGGKVAGGVLADLTGQQLFDIATGKIDEYLPQEYRLDGKYGIAGQIARGEIDAAGRNVLSQALMSGAFTALQSVGNEPAKPPQSPETAPAVKPPDSPVPATEAAGGANTVAGGSSKVFRVEDVKGLSRTDSVDSTISALSAQGTAGKFVERDSGNPDQYHKKGTVQQVFSREGFGEGEFQETGTNQGIINSQKPRWQHPALTELVFNGEASDPKYVKLQEFAKDMNAERVKLGLKEVAVRLKSDAPVSDAAVRPEPNRPSETVPPRPESGSGTIADDPNMVGIRHASTEARREELGLSPVRRGGDGTWADSMDLANRVARSAPERVDRIMEKAANREALTQDEMAVVHHRITELDNKLNDAQGKLELARESGNPDAIADAEAARNAALESLDQATVASDFAGSVGGAALNYRKAMLARDFSAVRMMAQAERANGGQRLEPEVKQQIADLSAKLQKQEAEVLRLEKEMAEAQEAKAVEQRTGQSKGARRTASGRELAKAWDDFRKVAEGRLFANPLDPELLVAGAKVAKAAAKHGIASLQDFLDWTVSKQGKPLDPNQVAHYTEAWKRGQAEIHTENNERYKQRIEKNEHAISNVARELAKIQVENGVTDRNILVDNVWFRMLEFDPELTRRQVMDAISGYGQYQLLSKDADAVMLRDLKGQLQQVAKLEDMAAGQAPSKTGVERRVPSAEERGLIKQVNEAKKVGGFDVLDPETQLKSALDAVKTRLRNQIEDMNAQIEKGKKTVKERSRLEYDQEANELVKERNRVKDEYEEVFGKPGMSDAERLAVLKRNLEKRNAELERQIAMRDFGPKPKKPQPKPDKELLEARIKNTKLKEEKAKLMREIENSRRSVLEKAFRGTLEVTNNATKTAMSSIDAPFGRQGLFAMVTHPISTIKAIPKAWRAFGSEVAAERYQRQLEERPNFKNGTYKAMEIDFTKQHGEEGFMSKIFDKIPNAINYFNASERAFRTAMNQVRADTADYLVGTLANKPGGLTTGDMRVLGNFVNVTTGRLSPGRLKAVTQALNVGFFAPQYAVSKFYTAIGQPIWGRFGERSPAARKAIAKEYAKFGLGLMTVLTALKTAKNLSESDEFDVGVNPLSADFGQVRFGNTRIDLTGGLKQYYVLASRMWKGKTLTQEGLEKDADARDLVSQFLWQKAAPGVSLGLELATGKDATGRDISPGQAIVSKVTPIFTRDFIESAKDLGLPKAFIPWALGSQGFGVNTYTQTDKSIGTLYQHAYRTPRPTRSAGMTLEEFQKKVQNWQTQREGARKILERTGKTQEQLYEMFDRNRQETRMKSLGRAGQ